MEIKGKIHCFFEQSGTFKNEFKKLGYAAEDYDIQNNFGETDHVIDLFAEIERGYNNEPSIFDGIPTDDLILAFFPCIYFCDMSTLNIREMPSIPKESKRRYEKIISLHEKRNYFFILLQKMFCISMVRGLRLIFENPYSNETYLKHVLRKPDILDKNRMLRGDYMVKPTGYWFFNCCPTHGNTLQFDKQRKIISKYPNKAKPNEYAKGSSKTGLCSEDRSMISSDYARNFICDFVIGKAQNIGVGNLFDNL